MLYGDTCEGFCTGLVYAIHAYRKFTMQNDKCEVPLYLLANLRKLLHIFIGPTLESPKKIYSIFDLNFKVSMTRR